MDVPGPRHQYAVQAGLHTGEEEVVEVHPECRGLQFILLCREQSLCGRDKAAPELEDCLGRSKDLTQL